MPPKKSIQDRLFEKEQADRLRNLLTGVLVGSPSFGICLFPIKEGEGTRLNHFFRGARGEGRG